EPSKVFWRLRIERSCLREKPVLSIASSFVNHRLRSSSHMSQIPAPPPRPRFRYRLGILPGSPGVWSPSHLQSRVVSCAAFHGQRFAIARTCVAPAMGPGSVVALHRGFLATLP
ncbi:hypothetical protein T484DRAFT_1988787, partial [Baffinella frigidus]